MATRHLSVVVVAGLVVCGLPARGESAIEREAQDRAQIENLMWRARAMISLKNESLRIDESLRTSKGKQ
jgi:hypothetical protein